jgi:hypothetical protein
VQPPILIRAVALAGRQNTSSPSGSWPELSGLLVSSPSGLLQVESGSLLTAAHYSK